MNMITNSHIKADYAGSAVSFPIRQLGLAASLLIGTALAENAGAAPIFVDWTSADLVQNSALGNLGGIGVVFNGGDIDTAVLDGSSATFSSGLFSPAIGSTDRIGFLGYSGGDTTIPSPLAKRC